MYNELKLNSLLKNVIDNVPFYQNCTSINRKKPQLSEFPVVNKEIINQNYLSFQSQYLSPQSDVLVLSSSGSTGEFIKVIWDQNEKIEADFTVWRLRNKWYGITPSQRWISFHSELYSGNRLAVSELSRNYTINKNLMSININLVYTDLDKVFFLIQQYQPKWILAFPSVLNILAVALIHKNNILPSIKYIECMGEMLFADTRTNIAKAFPDATIANMYGTTETGVIALECPYGHMHVVEDNCIVECDKNNHLLITSLTNRKFPIIRYEIKDIAEIDRTKCKFASGEYILKSIIGRANDMILMKDGTKRSAFILAHIFELINDEFVDCVIAFQVIQENVSIFNLQLLINRKYFSWKPIISCKIRNHFEKIIDSNLVVNINFYLDYIPNKSSKLKYFICKTNIKESNND